MQAESTTPPPLRVAYLVNQYPKVSHSFIRREIAALERRGVQVLRIAARGWDGPLVDAEDMAERAATRYLMQAGAVALGAAVLRAALASPRQFVSALGVALRLARRADRPLAAHLAYLAQACLLREWLRREHIEHLHAHFGTNPAAVALLVRALGGPRYSFTVHGPEEFDKATVLGLPEKIAQAAFVVAVSSFGRSQLYRWADAADWPKVEVVHCGLDPAFLDAAVARKSARNLQRLVCVGRLCEQKGQLLLISAAHRLALESVPFELVLAGDGELRSACEKMIASHRLERHVRITGWVAGETVRELLESARALVLPSFAEGLPVVIMEAMALARPVVSTTVAGIPELVRDGREGWLVPAGDVDALVGAMRACLAAPVEELERLGGAGRQRVAERHDVDTEAGKLARLFERARSSD